MPIAELWTIISNQIIKQQLPHTRFDQIHNHKCDKMESCITKLLAQATNKILLIKYYVYENWTVAFFFSMVSSVTVWKNSIQTFSEVEKVLLVITLISIKHLPTFSS